MTEHPNLAAALVAALADLSVVNAGRTAKIPGKDGKQGYSYDYADIADVIRLTRPVLAANGVVALTPVHDHGPGLGCTVVFLHTSGERMDLGKDAQATGSMVTYHRRYALVAALGMAAGEDDDGATAAPRQEHATEPQGAPAGSASKRDLVAQLAALGLPTNGTEEVLRARLEEHNKIEGGAPDRKEGGDVEGGSVHAAGPVGETPPSSDLAERAAQMAGKAALPPDRKLEGAKG